MVKRLIRFSSGALVIVCVAAPGSATVVTTTRPAVVNAGALKGPGVSRARTLRSVPVAGSRIHATVTGPAGCRFNGPSSFIGEAGIVTGVTTNFAGGSDDITGLAGVVAGSGNTACDGWSGILAGDSNIVGGDNSAEASVISGGLDNGVENAPSAIVGAGGFNIIGGTSPYTYANDSAIVSGYSNTIGSPYSFIGAGLSNTIVATTNANIGQSAFIGSGYSNAVSGNLSGIVGGQLNSVASDNSTIVGGSNNTLLQKTPFSSILGGSFNSVASSNSTIVGGSGNRLSQNAIFSSILGGINNTNGAEFSVISGGSANAIPSSATAGGEFATIGGGYKNSITGEYATIAGGGNNAAAGTNAVVAGGSTNSASGSNATIPGGAGNVASGSNSFAAGTSSKAANTGTFVWSDDSAGAKTLSSSGSNQFLARAAGGFYLYSSASLSSGVKLSPGSGAWSNLSDRAAKTAIENIDDARILAKVASLPVSEWSYSEQGGGIRHLGPMAQDFRAAFGLGEDDKHIATVDEEGIALAAIKALHAQLVEKDRELVEMRRMFDSVHRADDARLARLEQRLDAVEDHSTSEPRQSF